MTQNEKRLANEAMHTMEGFVTGSLSPVPHTDDTVEEIIIELEAEMMYADAGGELTTATAIVIAAMCAISLSDTGAAVCAAFIAAVSAAATIKKRGQLPDRLNDDWELIQLSLAACRNPDVMRAARHAVKDIERREA